MKTKTKTTLAILFTTAALAAPAGDDFSTMGLYTGSGKKDTRTEAQKLLQSRGGAITNPAPKAGIGLPPDIREVDGVRYHVEKLREWFITKRGPQPLPAWDLVEGTVSSVGPEVVLVQRRTEFSGNQIHYQPVAVRNWPGTPKLGQLCSFYAMEMKEPHTGSNGQPLLLFDCGRRISASGSAQR